MRDTIELIAALDHPNCKAALRLIRAGETTQSEDAYRWLFGSTKNATKLFDSYADHPRVKIYEKYDGQFIKNGKIDYTTAAGAYQITETTWNGLVEKYDFASFEPRMQDVAALALIDGRGALEDVISGRVESFMFKCRREWASLPHSDYGQPTQTITNALTVFTQYGGTIASEPSKEKPVLPFIAAALPALIQAAPSLIRIFGDSPQADKNAKAAELVAGIAKEATGEQTIEGAVNAIESDPAKAAAYREAVHLSMGDIMGIMERANAMEQQNIKSARDYNAAEANIIDAPWLKMKFIHILSLGMLGYTGWFAATYWLDLTPELRGAVLMLMVIAGWNGIKDYWTGSSSGSDRKTTEIIAASKQG